MKSNAYKTVLTAIALVLFCIGGAQAQTETQAAAQKPMQHDMSTMDMSGMKNEPHHVLAMAYIKNIGTFATALQSQAEGTVPLDAQFARAAAAEIRRSLDQIAGIRHEHMKMMTDEMRATMAPMMKEMDTHHAMLAEAVSRLEKDVLGDHPDAMQVAADCAVIRKHLDDMAMMRADANEKMKM